MTTYRRSNRSASIPPGIEASARTRQIPLQTRGMRCLGIPRSSPRQRMKRSEEFPSVKTVTVSRNHLKFASKGASESFNLAGGAEVVHRLLEPERLAPREGFARVRDERVARREPEPLAEPVGDSDDAHVP